MSIATRRQWLGTVTAVALAARSTLAAREKLRIGVTDWNLHLGADPKAVPLASQLGFEGVQISFGRKIVDGKMPVDNPEIIAQLSCTLASNTLFPSTEPALTAFTTMA